MKMKVSLWNVLSIAVALVLGCAVTSNAFMVKVDEDTWADFAVRGQLSYHNFDKRSNDSADPDAIDYHQNYFELTEAEFYVKGQINDSIQFFTQWECVYIPLNIDGTKVTGDNAYKKDRAYMKETGVNLLFAPEFKVRFGRIRIPVSRYHQRSDYGKIIPTDYFHRYDVHGVFTGNLSNTHLDVKKTALNIREPGVVLFGDFFDGMLRYHTGLFNQPNDDNHYKNLRYTARLAFTPTMLGFKPESSLKGTRKDSYLGKKDILTIGAGYSKEEIWEDLDNEMYAVDAFFEKKYGSIVPNLGFGYIEAKETHRIDNKPQDSAFWFVQGQLLYDEVVGFGKPSIGAKFERMESDKAWDNKDVRSDRVSVALNYFLKGYNVMISLCVDNVNYKDGAEDYLEANNKEDSITDYSLFFQFKF
ncbi:MAG: hypothetical protein JRG74_06245 [Deltaproteobacteria bacterium]|nr:hypothetical protein [Deltaproteobacteria bacterium]